MAKVGYSEVSTSTSLEETEPPAHRKTIERIRYLILFILFSIGLFIGFIISRSSQHQTTASSVEHGDILTLSSTGSPSSHDLIVKDSSANVNFSRRLCYEHFPKAGGQYVRSILRGMNLDYKLSKEFEHKCDRSKHFVIGSIREPCSYYVSLFAYGCEHHGFFYKKFADGGNKEMRNKLRDRIYANVSSIETFKDFIHVITDHNMYGPYSYRAAYKYGGGGNKVATGKGIFDDRTKKRKK